MNWAWHNQIGDPARIEIVIIVWPGGLIKRADGYSARLAISDVVQRRIDMRGALDVGPTLTISIRLACAKPFSLAQIRLSK